MKFKKGDIVKYTGGGHGDSRNNPLWNGRHGMIEGEVTYSCNGQYCYGVKWNNGQANSYTKDDLELIWSFSCVPKELFEI